MLKGPFALSWYHLLPYLPGAVLCQSDIVYMLKTWDLYSVLLQQYSDEICTDWLCTFAAQVLFIIPHFRKSGLICSIHRKTFASWSPYIETSSHFIWFSFCLWCWTQISIMALIYHCLQVITMTELFMSLNVYVFHFNHKLFIKQRQSLWNKLSLLVVKNDPNISTLFRLHINLLWNKKSVPSSKPGAAKWFQEEFLKYSVENCSFEKSWSIYLAPYAYFIA